MAARKKPTKAFVRAAAQVDALHIGVAAANGADFLLT